MIIPFRQPDNRAQMERALDQEAAHWSEVIREAEARLRAVHAAQDYLTLQDDRYYSKGEG